MEEVKITGGMTAINTQEPDKKKIKEERKKEKKAEIKSKKFVRELHASDLFYPLMYIAFSLIVNVISFLWLGMPVFPKYFLLDFSIVLLLATIIFIIPQQKIRKIVTYVLLILALIIHCVNACVYKVFGDVFHLQMILLLRETAGVMDLSYFNIPSIIVYLGVLGMFIIASKFFSDRAKNKNVYYSRSNFKSIGIICLAMLVPVSSFFAIAQSQINNSVQAESQTTEFNVTNDEALYKDLIFKYDALQKFGYFGFYTKEIVNFVFGANLALDSKERQEILTLLQQEHNNYTDTTNKGVLEGDNLVCILTESLEWFAIDPYYTPTLYEMYNSNAVTLTNYYAKNKTNVSEGIVNFGAMPSTSTLSEKPNGKAINLPYSLANMFANRGYSSDYFHSFLNYYYNRNLIMPKVGFENLYFSNQLDLPHNVSSFGSIGSDLEFFNAIKDELIKADEPFFSAYATMSTHSTYDRNKKAIEYLKEGFNDTEKFADFSDYLKTEFGFDLNTCSENDKKLYLNYKVGAIDLDNTIKAMLEDIEAKGIADKTTIVLFADHNAYGNDLGFIVKDLNHKSFYLTEAFRVPACIYSPKLSAQKIDAFTNTYDIYKTIAVLFNLDINNLICNGYNVFDPQISQSFLVSFTNGIIKDNLYSRDYDTIYYNNGDILTDKNKKEEFIDYINRFYYKQLMVDKIYKNNLFSGYKIDLTTGTLVKA